MVFDHHPSLLVGEGIIKLELDVDSLQEALARGGEVECLFDSVFNPLERS